MGTGVKYWLKRTGQVARAACARDAWSRKALNLSYALPGEIRLESTSVILLKLGLRVPRGSFEFLLDSYHHLRNLSDRLSAKFYFDGDLCFVQIAQIRLNLTTAEEAFIVSEVFLAGAYEYACTGRFVVVDIGMNVGFATLFFASKPDVLKVYGFEPFKRTFDQALRNFENNPQLRDKIHPFNCGLNGEAQRLTVNYNYDNKGQVGIYGTDLILDKVQSASEVDILLKEATSELKGILAEHSAESWILKLDCEGAEYAIISNLFKRDLLSQFRIIFIEWHDRGPDNLSEMLIISGFAVFSQQSPTKKVGMLYAIK